MRKFLSLVMALVMMMSLVTINAGAKEFADNDDIQYVEAVEVIGEVGVVDGYASGDFGPTNGLTRQAAAKIICNLILGPTTAAELHADSAPYPDVPLNHDFAGYIAYCKQQGIVSGYADGTFKGGNPLTGYAFMKMLLGALGYDAEIEGYTGENWSINVAKQALGIGLNNGLVDDFNGVDYVTREEAALYAFNTLKATMVDYEEKITVQAGLGGTVTIGNSKAYEVGNYLDTDGNIKNDGLMQFAEKFFGKLTVRGESDAFARPANTWRFKGSKVGTYAETPDATYSKNTKLGTIYADLGMSEKDGIVEVYIDGIAGDNVAVAKNNTYSIAQYQADGVTNYHNGGLVGNGSTVEVFYFEDTNDVRICVINNWAGTIERTVDATSAKERYVEIDFDGTVRPASINVAGNDEFETEVEFEDDTVVSYTYSEKDDCIMSITELESVTGVLDTIVANKSLTIGETVYSNSKNRIFGVGLTNEDSLKTAGEYTLYLDEYGYGIYVEEEEFVSSDYALILAIESTAGNFTTNRVKLLCADGTEMVSDTAKNYLGVDYGYVAGDIVTWKKNDAGKLVLRRVSASYEDLYTEREEGSNGTANPDFVTWNNGGHQGGTTTFDLNSNESKVTVDGGSNDFYANSSTVFVVRNSSGKYSVYTGIKSVPSINPTASGDKVGVAYYCRTNGLATVVFIDAAEADIIASSNDVIFLAGNSASNRTTDIDGNVYYTFNAVVKGELKSVKVQSNLNTQTAGIFDGANKPTKAELIFGGAHYDDGNIINVTAVGGTATKADTAAGAVTGTVKHNQEYTVGAGTLGGSLTWHTVAKDAKIWLVDNDGVITAGSYNSIKTDALNVMHWVKNNGELTDIFLQLPASTNPVAPDGTPNVLTGLAWTSAPAAGSLLSVNLTGFNVGQTYSFDVTTVIGGANVGTTTYTAAAPVSGTVVLPITAATGTSYVVRCGNYTISASV